MILAKKFNGTVQEIKHSILKKEKEITVTISKDIDVSSIKEINFDYFGVVACDGDEGYLIVPNEGMLCRFCGHNEEEYITDRYAMPIFGVKTKEKTFVAIVTGMAYDYKLVCGVHDGKYYIFPRFEVDGEALYEDISVTYHFLYGEDADYSGMARTYRKYQLDRGECIPLKERAKGNSYLAYAKGSVMIRIRLAWKPMPSPILHQTIQNEPEVQAVCSFKQVGCLLDELKRQGVDKAEICLVGWNTKGHDGRWPQCFPVCEEIGGEEELKRLINKAQNMGYQIVCHTNSTDAYEISELWNEDNLIKNKNGSYPDESPWSGGQMYQLCPKTALDLAHQTLPKVAELGFRGIHYLDVLNTVMPRKCYHKKHPLNVKESIEESRKLMEYIKKLFGGYSSEGGYDFGAKYLDYALNLDYGEKISNPLCDEVIPLWQLVYHGIILSNPNMTDAMNYPVSDDNSGRLKLIEYGGRPTFYYYSRFRNDWQKQSDKDMVCGNEVELKRSVAEVLDGYELCKELSYLQDEFMEKHEKLSEGAFLIKYSDGTRITVDYNKQTYFVEK